MRFEELQGQADQYLEHLRKLSNSHRMTELLVPPVDHFAVKLADTSQYERYLDTVLSLAEEVSYTNMNNRRIACALLKQPISFGDLGEAHILEIMEPKPEKANQGFAGLEHIELYRPELSKVQRLLDAAKLPSLFYENPFHRATVLKLGNGQEIKFTDTKMLDVIAQEARHGNQHWIKKPLLS